MTWIPPEEFYAQIPRKFNSSGIIFYDQKGRILLQKLNPKLYNGEEKYNLPGGIAEHDESPFDCLKREVQEEMDIGLLTDQASLFAVDHQIQNGAKIDNMQWIFQAQRDNLSIKLNKEEILDVFWADKDFFEQHRGVRVFDRVLELWDYIVQEVFVYMEERRIIHVIGKI